MDSTDALPPGVNATEGPVSGRNVTLDTDTVFESKTTFKYDLSKWDVSGITDMGRKILFIITSKIIVSNNKLSYTNCRSIYTVDERFKHTIETINSIKENINNPLICLIDNSKLNNKMNEILSKNVDYFIDRAKVNSVKNIDYFTDESYCKGTAEMHQFEIALNYLKKNISDINDYQIFKITGRYKIKNNIDVDNFINEKFVFKKNKLLEQQRNIFNYYYTCFYKFPGSFIDLIIDTTKIFTNVERGRSFILDNKYAGLEVALPELIKKRIPKDSFKEVDELGIEQRLSVTNDYQSYVTTKII